MHYRGVRATMKRINGIEIATSETRSSSRPRLQKLLAGLIPRVYSFSNMAARSVSQNLPKLGGGKGP